MLFDLGPFTLTHHGHLFGDIGKDAKWDLYITYPYILWDAITQYQCIDKIYCQLCSDDGFMPNPLFHSGEWFNGRIDWLNPRVVYGTHTCTLLVSRGHQVSACRID